MFISRKKFHKRESKTREKIVSLLVMFGYAIDRPRCCRKVERRFDLVRCGRERGEREVDTIIHISFGIR